MNILKQYKNVFRDMITCYMDSMEVEDKQKISNSDIDCIVDRLIYKSEYMWEIIDDTIQSNIDRVIEMRNDNNG